MTATLTEVRQAARRLAGSPGYSAGLFLMLTLGLALSVGMYTVLNGVLLNGLPYPGGERVVHVESVNAIRNESGGSLTAAEALALADAPIFDHAGWYMWGGETVLSGERPREMTVHRVSGGYFPALGVEPQIGRWIGPGDVGPDSSVVVLSDEEWGRLANRDPEIIGKPLKLSDQTVTVIGVMPPEVETGAGLWLAADPGWLSEQHPDAFVNTRYLDAVARLVEGADARAAADALDALSAQVRMTHGLPDEGWRLRTTSLLESLVGDVRGVLAGVFVVSLVVLAIACANVGSLLAARLAGRERELAIVQALGATSARVWRGMLIELLLLGSLATGAALLLLVLGLGAFRSLAAGILPRADAIALDTAVLGFAAGVALLCVLLVALPFGIRLRTRMSQNLSASGKGAGGTSRGSLSALPVAGLALATTALIAGSAVALSLGHLRAVEPGYRASDVHVIQLYHGGEADELRRFANAVLTRMQSEPEVEAVALTSAAPLTPIGGYSVEVEVPGRERPEPMQAGLRLVTPGYLEVLSQKLLAGRGFLQTDNAGAPRVAIVNQAFARGVFGDDALGREIVLPLGNGERAAHRIVGIAANIRNAGLRNPANPEVLVPFWQSPWIGMTFLARAPGAGETLPARLQEAVWSVAPEEAITRVSRLHDDLESEFALVSFFTRMLGGFALLAIALAAFGTYSVVAFLQRHRIREIGVRLALGAEPADVARRVLLQGAWLAALAGIGGCLAAIAVLRLLGSQLFGVSAATPVLYALGLGGVLLAALLASAAPAWRAARVQPMSALRYE